MAIDLDNMFNDDKKKSSKKKATEQPSTPSEEKLPVTDLSDVMDLMFVGTPEAEAEPTVDIVAAASTSVESIYDQYQKLIYLIDRSGSMADRVPNFATVSVDQFEWEPYELEEIEAKAKKIADAMPNVDALPGMYAAYIPVDALEKIAEMYRANFTEGAPDWNVVKAFIVSNELYQHFHLLQKPAPDGDTKMGLVKKAVSDFAEKRFAKFPDSDVSVFAFDTQFDQLVTPAGRRFRSGNEVRVALDQLYPRGGTRIRMAIEMALEHVKKAPSSVGLHHFIVVTDGEDGSALDVPHMIPQLKDRGVVVDYLYIKGRSTSTSSQVAEAMKKVCTATGGEYFEVRTAQDFETRFLQASTRLCLPPGKE